MGLLIGVVTLRLKGPYFAAVTFCFGALLYKWFMISSKFLGGEEGLSGIAPLTESTLRNYYFSGLFMLAVIFLLYLVSKSSFGLILRSIGENEIASEGSGINTTYYKVVAFMYQRRYCRHGRDHVCPCADACGSGDGPRLPFRADPHDGRRGGHGLDHRAGHRGLPFDPDQ